MGQKVINGDINVNGTISENGVPIDPRLLPDDSDSDNYIKTLVLDHTTGLSNSVYWTAFPDLEYDLVFTTRTPGDSTTPYPDDPDKQNILGILFVHISHNNMVDALSKLQEKYPDETIESVSDFIRLYNNAPTNVSPLMLQMIWGVKANIRDFARVTYLEYTYDGDVQHRTKVLEILEPTYSRDITSETNLASLSFHDADGVHQKISLGYFTAVTNVTSDTSDIIL